MQDLTTLQHAITTIVTTPRTALLLVLLLAAAISDVRTFRIPNVLTFPGMLLGLLVSAASSTTFVGGLLNALAGLGVALLCLVPMHMLRVMGAGDVKLMAAVGAFLGFPDVLPAMIFVFLTGGTLAVGYIVYHRVAARAARNLGAIVGSLMTAALTGTAPTAAAMASAGRLPYGVCIFGGTALFLVVRQVIA